MNHDPISAFLAALVPDADASLLRRRTGEVQTELASVSPEAESFVQQYGGLTFASGLYRVAAPHDVEPFTELALEAFPGFRERVVCFGSDWMGRQFALDRQRGSHGMAQVLMLEPGTGEALEIPADFLRFHGEELVSQRDAALSASFFEEWRATVRASPFYGECVGYVKPLYLGGLDEVENLELQDFSVYWSVSAQLLAKTRALRQGTRVKKVSIE